MGAYNTLIVNSKCSNCNQETDIRIQFKYGDLWLYEYQINQELKWGGNDYGKKDAKKVIVDCVGEECKKCGVSVDYLIFVEDNIIRTFEKNRGQYDFLSSNQYYLVIE